MESTFNLLLNETEFNELSGIKKEIYILEWLRYLDKSLVNTPKVSVTQTTISLINLNHFFRFSITSTFRPRSRNPKSHWSNSFSNK